LQAGAGDDLVFFDNADSSIDGGTGYDTLVVRDAARNLSNFSGSLGNFEAVDLRGNGDNWLKIGTTKLGAMVTSNITPLTVHADVGDSLILGGTLVWRANADIVVGGTRYLGAEVYNGASLVATLKLSENLHVLTDATTPTSADQWVAGTGGSETSMGSGGDDYMSHSRGADTIDGGDGIDTLDFSDQTANVYVNMGSTLFSTGNFTVAAGTAIDGYGTVDTLRSIEHVRTGNGNDVVQGTDNAERIVTLGGKDSVNAGAGNDTVQTGDGVDFVYGGDGDDWIDAGTGNDAVWGDAGSDTVRGGAGDDTLMGGDGLDVLDYSDQTNSVVVNLSTSLYRGVAAGQATDGQGGVDIVGGFELLQGGAGNDYLVGISKAYAYIGGVRFTANTEALSTLIATDTISNLVNGTSSTCGTLSIGSVAFTADKVGVTNLTNSSAITLLTNASHMTLDGSAGSDVLIAGNVGNP
jgi:Ca2+-binding RTX toxin-like protein